MRRAESIRFEMPGKLVSPAAWYGRDMSENHSWLEQLSAEEVGEILTAVRTVNDKNVSMLGMRREDFNLPTLSARMRQLARELDQGRGFWVLRGLPVDKMSERDAALAYWGLGLHMGTPVSQNARGHLLGHVIDEGVDIRNHSVRGYQTSGRLPYHTDSSDVVGLLCLLPAKQGGASSIASSTSIWNELLQRRQDLAHLWFEPWYFDRRNEQQPGKAPWFVSPLATWDGEHLSIRYVRPFLESATRHDDVPELSPERVAFLDLIDEILAEPGFALQTDFRPGDMQFLSNYAIVHARTAYEDYDDPARKRHLLRLWLSMQDAREIPSDFGRGHQTGGGGRGGIAAVSRVSEPLAGTYE